MHTLRAEGLVKVYRNQRVVNGVSLGVSPGEIVGLLGPNGAGKTTTFLMMAGMVRPDGGEVWLEEHSIGDLPPHRRAQLGMVYLPQQHSVFMKATVEDNLLQILETRGLTGSRGRERANALLEEFGLEEINRSLAYQLSGGEKRRLEIARAMIMEPRFLFLDEPFTGIDPITILEIQKIIRQLQAKDIGIIITDHNVKDTFDITCRVYVLHQGLILSEGPPDLVMSEPQTRKLFLGEDFDWEVRPRGPGAGAATD